MSSFSQARRDGDLYAAVPLLDVESMESKPRGVRMANLNRGKDESA